MTRSASFQRGVDAERLACDFYVRTGYEVMAVRYKTPHGEIDIVARSGNAYVFCEVKARPSIDAALDSITARQQRRIMDTALIYCAQFDAPVDMRFDVICVDAQLRLYHLPNAWGA